MEILRMSTADEPVGIGICTSAERLKALKLYGFDFVELRMNEVAALSDGELDALGENLDALGLKVYAFNNFCSSELQLAWGAELERLGKYAERAMQIAHRLGAEVVVVGSGKSRLAPPEHMEEAEQSLVNSLSLIADIGAKYNIKIALEPLHRGETPLVNTLAEGAAMCRRVGRKNLGLVADLFHMYKGNEPTDEVEKYAEYVIHAHLARRDDSRYAPSIQQGAEETKEFYSALKRMGYGGRMTLESAHSGGFEASVERFASLIDALGLR